MIVEVVAVGTELLLGQIVNGNAATIGAALAEHGMDAHHQAVVGDNIDRIASVLHIATGRADAVIVTGGIGPTKDDLTREALCHAFGLKMNRSEEYAADLADRWRRSGREMPLSNLRQADYPEGAEMLANPKGSAPGLFLNAGGASIFVVPGVPEEMQYLLTEEVLPRLRLAAGKATILQSRVLRTWGRSESQVGEILEDLYETTNPSIAFLASAGEIKVRISAKGETETETAALIAPVEAEVRRRLGPGVFAADAETLEGVLAKLLIDRGWTMGTAESATGGLVAARVTTQPGASRYFRGSIVSYAPDLKESLLGVDTRPGLVTEATALAMAHGARSRLGVDVGVAVVGSAGPQPLEEPVGTMIVAVATPTDARARIFKLPGDRERIRTYTTTSALQLVRLAVTGEWWS
jgi:nicotinamide-nucleotide amidase